MRFLPEGPDIPSAALDYLLELGAPCNKLADFPMQGRQFNDQYRVVVFRNHIAFYRHDEVRGTVVIAKIIDGRRDILNLLS